MRMGFGEYSIQTISNFIMFRYKMNYVPGDKPYLEHDDNTTNHVILTDRISQYIPDRMDSDKAPDTLPHYHSSTLSDHQNSIMDAGQLKESYVLLEKIAVTAEMVPPIPITPTVSREEVIQSQPAAQEAVDETCTETTQEDEISMIREFLSTYPNVEPADEVHMETVADETPANGEEQESEPELEEASIEYKDSQLGEHLEKEKEEEDSEMEGLCEYEQIRLKNLRERGPFRRASH